MFASVRAWVKKLGAAINAVIAPVGWLLIGFMGVSFGVGWFLNWFEFVLIAAGFAVLLACAGLYLIGRHSYQVALNVTAGSVTAGDNASGAVVITNRAKRSSAATRFEVQVGSEVGSFNVPKLARDEAFEQGFRVPTERRAVIALGPVSSVRDDPFSLLRRAVNWTNQIEVLVHPKVVRLRGSEHGFLKDLEGFPSRDLSDSDMSFHALRDYAPGDDRRHVHWKSTARTGKLMVRQFEESRRSRIVIALDDRRGSYVAEPEFELAISCAASVALETIRNKKRLSLVNGQREVKSAFASAALDAYTRLDFAATPYPTHATTRLIGTLAADASAVIYVTGSTPAASDLRRIVAAMPLGATIIVLRCEVGQELRRNSLGIASITTVGDLEQLAAGMRLAAMA